MQPRDAPRSTPPGRAYCRREAARRRCSTRTGPQRRPQPPQQQCQFQHQQLRACVTRQRACRCSRPCRRQGAGGGHAAHVGLRHKVRRPPAAQACVPAAAARPPAGRALGISRLAPQRRLTGSTVNCGTSPVSHGQTRGPPKPSRGGGRRARAARHGMGQTSSPPGAAGSAESNEPRCAQNDRRATRNRGGRPKRDARDSGPRPPGGPAGGLDLECGRLGPPPSCAGGQGVMGHGRQK